jgi:hypothetical protein
MNPTPVKAGMADGIGIVENLLPHEIASRKEATGKFF